MQADNQIEGQSNGEFSNPEPSSRRLDLSLKIPPRPLGFGSSRNGQASLQSQGSSKGSSSPGGFFRGLSFKKKSANSSGEKSSLLGSDPERAPENSNIVNVPSTFSWQRCASLPVSHATRFSPSVSMPASARVSTEQDRPSVSVYSALS